MKYNHDMHLVVMAQLEGSWDEYTNRATVPILYAAQPDFELTKRQRGKHKETAQLAATFKLALHFAFEKSGVTWAELLDTVNVEAEDILTGSSPLDHLQLMALATLSQSVDLGSHAFGFIKQRIQLYTPVTAKDVVSGVGMLCTGKLLEFTRLLVPDAAPAMPLLAHLREAVETIYEAIPTMTDLGDPLLAIEAAEALHKIVNNPETEKGVVMYAQVARGQEEMIRMQTEAYMYQYNVGEAAARREVLRKRRYEQRREQGLIRKPGPKFTGLRKPRV